MRIEIDTVPSKLDERLETFRDPKTEHIILSPEEAKNVLFKALLSAYRESVAWPNQTVLTVDVLARIAESEGERVDFTKVLEKFKNERAEQERQAREKEETLGVLLPRTPPVPEI